MAVTRLYCQIHCDPCLTVMGRTKRLAVLSIFDCLVTWKFGGLSQWHQSGFILLASGLLGLACPWLLALARGSPAWTALEMMQDLSKCLSQLYSNQEYIIGITSLMASQVSASFVTCTHRFEPYRWRPCGVTWDSSRTVVVIKLRRTSALVKWLP